MQSSAYVPLCMHGNFTNRGSLATLRATLNFVPSFSKFANDAVGDVRHAIRVQTIHHPPFTKSILFLMLKLIKLVSTRTEYGGLIAALCSLNMFEVTASMRLIFSSFSFVLRSIFSGAFLSHHCDCCLASFGFKSRFVSANFFVLRTFFPIIIIIIIIILLLDIDDPNAGGGGGGGGGQTLLSRCFYGEGERD